MEDNIDRKPELESAKQEQAPAKSKTGIGWKIGCIVFAIIACGAVGYIAYSLVTAKSDNDVAANKTDCPTAQYDQKQMTEDEERVSVAEPEEAKGNNDGKKVVYPTDMSKYLPGDSKNVGGDVALNNPDGTWSRTGRSLGYATLSTSGTGTLIITKSGDVYYEPLYFCYDQYCIDKIVNYSKVAEYGEYVIPESEVPYVDFGGKNPNAYTFYGYKLKVSNIIHASASRFGNGDENTYIMLIDKDGNFNMLTLQFDGNIEDVDGVDVINRTAYMHRNVAEYQGAISVQGATDGSGRDNIVYFRDGSYKFINPYLFSHRSN